MKEKNKEAEFQKELKEEARDIIRQLHERLSNGRDYLMQIDRKALTVEDCLEAFGFNELGEHL